MLSLAAVSKSFDYRPVLQHVDLSLVPGRFYALRAPNGSGKTTLLQLMAGLIKPTEGNVLWAGRPLRTRERRHLGAVFQAPMVYGDLSATENLALFAKLYGLHRPKQVALEWVRRVRLETALELKARSLSKGMLQRLALARSLLHSPQLLLLDEPFDGLDSESVALAKRLVAERLDAGATIFMVTHNDADLEQADDCLTIRHGGVVPL